MATAYNIGIVYSNLNIRTPYSKGLSKLKLKKGEFPSVAFNFLWL